MKFEKYDKIIWRINGIVILIMCIFGVIGGGIISFELVKDLFKKRVVHDVVNVNKETKKKEYLRLGYFRELKNTPYILVPLNSEESISASYYSKTSSANIRNYLVFNKDSKKSKWVWGNNDFLITNRTNILKSVEGSKAPVVGIFFQYVDSDSTDDGVLSHSDKMTVSFFDLADNSQVIVEKEIDRIIGVEQTADTEVVLFYSKGSDSFFRTFDTLKKKVSEPIKLSYPVK